MPAIQDPVCHLTRKEKAGIWDRPRPKSKVRRPITSRHHLATDPKGQATTRQGSSPAPRASSSRRGPRGGVMIPPTLLQSLNTLSRSSQQQRTEALLYSLTWASVFCMGRVKLKVVLRVLSFSGVIMGTLHLHLQSLHGACTHVR